MLLKRIKRCSGVDTSNLDARNDFIALKAEVDKVDTYKLVNVPTGLNNLKSKVDNLHVNKLKTIPIYLKKLSDVVSKEVVKNTKFNKLNTTVNNLEKNPDETTLIHIIQ